MTRTEVLHAILDFMGPLGPFQDPQERDRSEEAWAADTCAVEQILDLIRYPPTHDELGTIAPEEFEYELSRILTIIGKKAPVAFINHVRPLLHDPNARPTIIEVLGSLGLEESLPYVEPLIGDRSLSEEDEVRLACALGEIGGDAALTLLKRLSDATPADQKRVHDEIGVAMQTARR